MLRTIPDTVLFDLLSVARGTLQHTSERRCPTPLHPLRHNPSCPACGAIQRAEAHTDAAAGFHPGALFAPHMLLAPMMPQNATPSQTATLHAIGQDEINRRGALVLAHIELQGEQGATPHEVAVAVGLTINQCRPVCTRLHQRGYIHRSIRTRNTPHGKPAHIYIGHESWTLGDGECLSRPHRGIGQEVVPLSRFQLFAAAEEGPAPGTDGQP